MLLLVEVFCYSNRNLEIVTVNKTDIAFLLSANHKLVQQERKRGEERFMLYDCLAKIKFYLLLCHVDNKCHF